MQSGSSKRKVGTEMRIRLNLLGIALVVALAAGFSVLLGKKSLF
jgi:hypothetical protein